MPQTSRPELPWLVAIIALVAGFVLFLQGTETTMPTEASYFPIDRAVYVTVDEPPLDIAFAEGVSSAIYPLEDNGVPVVILSPTSAWGIALAGAGAIVLAYLLGGHLVRRTQTFLTARE